MTDEQKPVTHTEQWVFGGSRVGRSGKRLHCWVDPTGEDLLYAPKGRYTIGSVYEAEVVRQDNGGVTRYGQPRYTGVRCDDQALVDRLAAQHRAAEVELDLAARERAESATNRPSGQLSAWSSWPRMCRTRSAPDSPCTWPHGSWRWTASAGSS